MSKKDFVDQLRVRPGSRLHLKDEEASQDFGWTKEKAEPVLLRNRERLSDLQYKMFADGRHALLVVLQGIDGAGKDGTIRHVLSAFNPQGCTVTGFKAPSAKELSHDYLWRIHAAVPPKGEVGVFNRSHYEDVIVVRVENLVARNVWSARYEQINAFEKQLAAGNTHIVKLFLQISREEQRERFQSRLRDPAKQWKFDPADLQKRKQWEAYRKAFEDAINRCSTEWAPWYVIPADRKWLRNLAVSEILLREMEKLPLRFPTADYDPAKIRITR